MCTACNTHRYVHFYEDAGIADCQDMKGERGGGNPYPKFARRAPGRVSARWRRFDALQRRWIRDRVTAELLMHVLHALGLITWVRP